MKYPTFGDLDEMRKNGESGCSYAQGMHSNPQFYKYYWWVFCKYSEVEGRAFISDEHRLPIARAMTLIKRLGEEKESYILYNEKLPRIGSPFDPQSAKWKAAEWAPRYEDDVDEVWNGHK